MVRTRRFQNDTSTMVLLTSINTAISFIVISLRIRYVLVRTLLSIICLVFIMYAEMVHSNCMYYLELMDKRELKALHVHVLRIRWSLTEMQIDIGSDKSKC